MKIKDNQKIPVSGRNKENSLPEISKTTPYFPSIKYGVRQIDTYAGILGIVLDNQVSQNLQTYQKIRG